MNTNGEQAGGVVGSMKTLQRLVDELSPTQVFIVWEGGGSTRRRALFNEYKMGRRPEKLNRFYDDDIPESQENLQYQLVTLIEFLKHVPICQLYVPDCEGDDVVAYLCRSKFRGVDKVIASSDKDMLQLLDDSTSAYSFHSKRYVKQADVLEDHRVHATNFAVAKALCGDPSDNIPGIKGLGFKTLAKRFPFLGTDTDVLLETIKSYSHVHLDEAAVYKNVIDHWDEVVRNYRLVYLDGSMLSPSQAARIDTLVTEYVPRADKVGFIRVMVDEGIVGFDVDMFFGTLMKLNQTRV